MTFSVIASILAGFCFVAGVLWAGATDLVTMKIRNKVVLILLASYAALAPFSGLGWANIGLSIAVASGVFITMFVFFGLGWVGGGDVKLASGITLWLGADQALAFFLYTALFGGILTILLLEFRMAMLPAKCRTVPWIVRLHETEMGVPYGVALAVAGLLIFPATHWMEALT